MKLKKNKKEKIKAHCKSLSTDKANNIELSTIKSNHHTSKKTKIILRKNETSQEFIPTKKKYKTIKFNDFPGFFNKKFNLTSYKKICDDSREKIKSQKRIYKPSHKRGNGIPDDLIERLTLLNKIINDKKFQNYYNKRPKGKKVEFEQMSNYMMDYYKTHNELEGLLMIFYFVCNHVKFYSKEILAKMKEEYEKQTEDHIFLDEGYFSGKYNPSPEDIYIKKIAASPNNITSFFEYFLKKLEIKYKHIDGYCKLMEEKEDNKDKAIEKKLKNKLIDNYLSKSKSASNLHELTSLEETFANHSWNAVFIRGEWYLIDAFFGSGGIIKENLTPQLGSLNKKVKQIFNIYYFMTPPQNFIFTHRPNEDYLQFLDKTLTFAQFYSKKFINYGDFYMGAFLNNVELLSHQYPLIEIKKDEKLEIKLRQNNFFLEGELLSVNLLQKIGEIKSSYDDEKKIFCLEPIFPGFGEYILRINSRPIISNDIVYTTLFDYRVRVIIPFNYLYFEKYKLSKNINENNKLKEKRTESTMLLLPKLNGNQTMQPKIIQDYSKVLPCKTNKIICYDNQDYFLIEPRKKILRKGIRFKFRIRIKGASNVYLLDGNRMTPLKRVEEDIYEGNKEIETDNVSICCLLKNRNVYTEVIKFMIHKDRSILSKSVFSDIKKSSSRLLSKFNIRKKVILSLKK